MKSVDYCDQGHPAHDPFVGCGPCRDEEAAGGGPRPYGASAGYRCSFCGRPAVVGNASPDRHADGADAADCANERGDVGWHAVGVGR